MRSAFAAVDRLTGCVLVEPICAELGSRPRSKGLLATLSTSRRSLGVVRSLPKAPRHDVHKYLSRDDADVARGSADVAWLSDMVRGIRAIICSLHGNLQAKEREYG